MEKCLVESRSSLSYNLLRQRRWASCVRRKMPAFSLRRFGWVSAGVTKASFFFLVLLPEGISHAKKTLLDLWCRNSIHQECSWWMGSRFYERVTACLQGFLEEPQFAHPGGEMPPGCDSPRKSPSPGQWRPSSSLGDSSSPSNTIKRYMGSPGPRQTPFINERVLFASYYARARLIFYNHVEGLGLVGQAQ